MKYLALLLLTTVVLCLDNGLGKTPPMGWNSWNKFHCNINETLIRQTADLLVSTGLAAKGYRFLNLDDCWQVDRNKTTGEIIEDRTKFPSGMGALGQYIHSKGLLFGLYSDAGYKTCEGRPGSLGYEKIDANTYAKWKVDYLKYDNCNNGGSSSRVRYPPMRDALNATGRPIYFSMCQWGQESPWIWASAVANSWRTTGDISGTYKSFTQILDKQITLSRWAGPGAWNDPDMLEVGNGGMTNDQYQAHFALWAALKSPLLIGCSLNGISSVTLNILGNEQVIAVNQDPLGKQADLLIVEGKSQVWGGILSANRFVYVCFNREDQPMTFNLDFNVLLPSQKLVKIRQIIDHQDVAVPSDKKFRTKSVNSHAVAMYIVTYE